jgi:uncharacterized membrane protein YczE
VTQLPNGLSRGLTATQIRTCVAGPPEAVGLLASFAERPDPLIRSLSTGPTTTAARYRSDVRWLLPPDRLGRRLARCVFGLVLFGVGIALIIAADLGAAPWDVFHTGVTDRTGIPVGTVIILTGVALLLLWIPLRERIGIGTVLNALLIGVIVDLALPLMPETDRLLPRLTMMFGGVVTIALGSGFYIGAGLGPGPRDGLMTGLAKRGISIGVARTGLEVAVLLTGVALGGAIGLGTAVFALGIGPLVEIFLPMLTLDPPTHPRVPAGAAASAPPDDV